MLAYWFVLLAAASFAAGTRVRVWHVPADPDQERELSFREWLRRAGLVLVIFFSAERLVEDEEGVGALLAILGLPAFTVIGYMLASAGRRALPPVAEPSVPSLLVPAPPRHDRRRKKRGRERK
jgi:hypothetical protein